MSNFDNPYAQNLAEYPYTVGPVRYDCLVTHAGTFHADEVFSTALLQIAKQYQSMVVNNKTVSPRQFWEAQSHWDSNLYDSLRNVVRTKDAGPYNDYLRAEMNLILAQQKIDGRESGPVHRKYLIYDIGLGPYDHHQVLAPRKNGVPFAAFGILWGELYEQLGFDRTLAEYFDRKFVQPIDMNDNTGIFNQIADLIKGMNPPQHQPPAPGAEVTEHTTFEDAVCIALLILWRELRDLYHKSEFVDWWTKHASCGINRYECENNEIVTRLGAIFDEKPDIEMVQALHPEIVAGIYPSSRGGYTLHIFNDVDYMTGKITLRWAMKPEYVYERPERRGDAAKAFLRSVDQFPGCTFVHKGGFMATFETSKDAQDYFSGLRENVRRPQGSSTHIVFLDRAPEYDLTYEEYELAGTMDKTNAEVAKRDRFCNADPNKIWLDSDEAKGKGDGESMDGGHDDEARHELQYTTLPEGGESTDEVYGEPKGTETDNPHPASYGGPSDDN